MRPNGLRFALSLLLLPPAAFAQGNAPREPVVEPAPANATQAQTEEVVDADAPPPADATPAPAEAAPATTVTEPAPAADAVVTTPEPAPQDAPPADAAAEPDPTATDAVATDAVAADAEATDPDAAEQGAQTSAEEDFADIYGQGYDPVADSTLPAAAQVPGAFDPWEGYNRRMHRFNNAVDRRIARPLARGYVKVVPRPVRLGVGNFFNNLSQPLTMVNSLLQGKPKQAGQSLGRFLLNSTVGIAGIFDPASRANIPNKSEDFGQTLGVWGWKRSRYFELPFFGPRTVRDVLGMAGDAPLSPLRQVEADRIRVPLQGLQLVDVRTQLLPTDSLREGAQDDYALVRDAWSQRRDYQIFGDRPTKDGKDLPDYLREEEDDNTVPVDAMPVVVPGNG